MSLVVKTRKYASISENAIKSVSLSLATSEDILEWSNGEVTKPETINYKSYKPEKAGLFDEVIFGPTTDYKCPVCSTKYKRSNEGQICEKTDECKLRQPEILPRSSKRTRMGHIHLASPVVHFWFFKINHSVISKLLGLKVAGTNKIHSKAQLEAIIYFKSHIVLDSGDLSSIAQNQIISINTAPAIYRSILRELLGRFAEGTEQHDEIKFAIEDLEELATSKIGRDYGIDFYELNDIIHEYSTAKISTGAKAIQYLLENVNIKSEIRRVKTHITKINKEIGASSSTKFATKIQQRAKLYKRLEILNGFVKSGQEPKSMLITDIPVIPADLRPLIQIDGGRHSTSDVNELYRRIIIRNNRLKKWIELDAPILIVQNELRMLQESVDALIDNTRRKPSPVMSKDNRPLKSIADALSGKKGRFRQNLLGKRVDYSGRSVIVVGPDLKMHQVGIPRQMAAKLFEPWIIRELIEAEIVSSIKLAKKLIEEEDVRIWPYVEKAIQGKLVLLNRAPTLHRLSIQAFEPVLVRGRAIKLAPLATTAFNADFDGDQMAVHVPVSPEAIREARELMLANKNILGPKDGEPIINPSQDMLLGMYFLTGEKQGAKGEGNFYSSYDEMIKAYETKAIHIHSRIALPVNKIGKSYLDVKDGYIVSTVGKFIFNQAFPTNFPFIFDSSAETLDNDFDKYIIAPGSNIREIIKKQEINVPLSKKHIAIIVREVFDRYVAEISMEDLATVIKAVNSRSYKDTIMKFSELKNYDGKQLSIIHSQILSRLVKENYIEISKRLTLENEGVTPIFDVKDRVELLEKVWFGYTNMVAGVLDHIKDLGFKYSMLSGVTMSISDIIKSTNKDKVVAEGEEYVSELKEMFEEGLITDDERYQLSISKWSKVKDEVQVNLNEIAETSDYNPIFMMMKSGARGNISNFVQLAGLRGLMANNKKQNKALTQNNIKVRSTVEVPVKSSFLEGLTNFEFYSSTHGARKGLTDTALNTANSGYLTRRLVDVAQNIIVKEADCGSDNGFLVKDIVDTKNNTIIVPFTERIEGRFTNQPVLDAKGNEIVPAKTLITIALAKKIEKAGIKQVWIRNVLGCQTRNGVCKVCYGKDLATNRVVQIGEAVGIVAAQSIGEPGTQLTMRTFHTGGVAGVEDITQGFDRLKQLIDATKKTWEKPAIIAKTAGEVISITKNDETADQTIIVVKSNGNEPKEYKYPYLTSRRLRVKVGDEVILGQKLVEGPIILDELLDVAGPRPVQSYLIKEIQRLYRLQGISISDKYIEVIIRQMLSKILIQDPGDSQLFAGSLVDIHTFKEANKKLLLKGKNPAYGQIVIKGAKQTPLLSESFLAAASYQETPKVLVHAAIEGKQDILDGLKENIIVGHKIPAGTATNYENKGKYDIRDPFSYFK